MHHICVKIDDNLLQNSKAMKIFKATIISILFLNTFVFGSEAQTYNNLPSELIEALKDGNSITLSSYFGDHIELAIQDNEAIYSKSQATRIMAKFFREFPPSNFEVKHTGGKSSASYVIGTLYTQSHNFRVNFLLKSPNGKPFIHQLHIEINN